LDFGFWILDFGLTPTTRVEGLWILNFGFGIFSAHQGRGMDKKKSKIGNLKSKIGTVKYFGRVGCPGSSVQSPRNGNRGYTD
jgi:hypothetical protein